MSNIDSTIWPMEPHTKAKHEILEEYLKPWFPILSKWDENIVYLDGFAGPGIYSKGEEGSPIIAIRTAVEHSLLKKFKKIVFWFIEKDTERAEKLTEILQQKFPRLPENLSYHVQKAEFASSLESTLDGLEKDGAKLAPTFAFLDPFGFSGLPMMLIKRMLSYEKCEVLITFMTGFVLRFHDELRENAQNALFGTAEWKKVDKITDPDEKRKFFLSLYVKQLKEVAGAKFVRTFEMIGKGNQTIYHLVYGTKHWKGLEVMKKAMLTVDKRGIYTFSDNTDPNQTFLLDNSEDENWMPDAANRIFEKFRGQSVTVETTHEFIITDTPYIFKKKILEYLEKPTPSKIVKVIGRKTKGFHYPDKCTIQFSQ